MTSLIPPRYRIIPGEIRSVSGFNPAPSESDLNRLMKKRSRSEMSDSLRRLLDEMREEAASLIRPRGRYGIFQASDEMKTWLPEADMVGLAVVTIGSELESRVDTLNEAGETTAAFLLDILGSAWAEGAADALDEVIGAEAAILGLRRDRRRSPGYHPWPLNTQSRLLDILGAHHIGIRLTSGDMMIPRKSVSFGVKLFRSNT